MIGVLLFFDSIKSLFYLAILAVVGSIVAFLVKQLRTNEALQRFATPTINRIRPRLQRNLNSTPIDRRPLYVPGVRVDEAIEEKDDEQKMPETPFCSIHDELSRAIEEEN